MKIFLKILSIDFKNQSRDLRELSVVNTFKIKIIVMAKGRKNYTNMYDRYIVHQRTTRPLGDAAWLLYINRILSIFTWAYYARNIRPSYISCHDLSALFIGWLSTWFLSKAKKPLLIYDAHEFEIGRNTKRNKVMKIVITKLEKFLMKKCVMSIVVNDSIAEEMQKIHKLKERPVVVRNIPNYWALDGNIRQKRREEICKELEVPYDTFIIMYHGGILPGRGIENLLKALTKTEDVAVVILGYGEESYIESLKQNTEELKIFDRVSFYKAVPVDILWQYVGAADVGMITIPPVTKSYYYMLPNKLFENIQALTPIIGSDFPEVRRIIKGYDIGLLVNPESIEEIVQAIKKMRVNKEMYNRFKKNLQKAKEELCWENECKVLKEAYARILE